MTEARSKPEPAREHGGEHGGEHQVTPLELFVDLVLVFAVTQVTRLLAAKPTWRGVLRGMLVLAAVWWAWSVYAIFARRRLTEASGVEQARIARDAYGYLHLPMVAGVVLFALGLQKTLAHVGHLLDPVPAVGLAGGAALYLLGHVAFLLRTTGRVFRRRSIGAVALIALIPAALVLPALAALALVSAVCSVVVASEAIRYRDVRLQVRHPHPQAAGRGA